MARKLVWKILFLALAAGAGVLISVKPWIQDADAQGRSVWRQLKLQQERSDRARADMRAAEKERAELAAERARLESSAGKEALARERGYKRPGETILVLGEGE
ncbi:MAG TPA: hypothetical protein PLO61_07750 [Fimbriimonadaceae bacterium]|nr:hypothetical protein [Fimbriimonadaceae bacterium]HRJ34097.1 hypothetical protein [Fimbriimonadaceae bacterium]